MSDRSRADRLSGDGLLAILLDCGDTLVDEGTEVKNDLQETQHAELIPGALDAVRTCAEMGFPLALVADGPSATFRNVLGHYGLLELFDVRVISAEVGVEKPAAVMFETALAALGIAGEHSNRVIMVGNNLERDIAGANALGIASVWLNWAPRRAKVPVTPLEVPDYEISSPSELVGLVQKIDASLRCAAARDHVRDGGTHDA